MFQLRIEWWFKQGMKHHIWQQTIIRCAAKWAWTQHCSKWCGGGVHEYTVHTSPENIKSFFCCCCSCGTPYGHFDALKLLTGIFFFFFYSKQHATWSVHPASHLRALFFCPTVTWQRFPCRGIYCLHALSLRVFTQFPVLSQRLRPTLSGLIAFWGWFWTAFLYSNIQHRLDQEK